MLNESYLLSEALVSSGIKLKEWDDAYYELPNVSKKSPCIRIWLAKEGSICELESVSAELARSLRKFGTKQGTFPAFNIAPLYRIIDENQIKELKGIEKDNTKLDINKIRAWCTDDNWNDGRLVNKLKRCLHSVPQSMMKLISNLGQPENALITELVRLADSFSDKPGNRFKAELEKCIFAKLQKQEEVNVALYMLFHKGDSKKAPKDDTGPSVSVILDLFDWRQYRYPVASRHITEWINNSLLCAKQATITKINPVKGKIDAFGAPLKIFDKPMPSVDFKAAGISDVKLRSMFSEHPCQYRYNTIENGSYPISPENRSLSKKALEWVADSEREDVTWQKVDMKEIIFVYPSKLPEVPPRFVSIFGSKQTESAVKTEARFENIAKEFIKTLKGLPTDQKPDYIQIFTIRKLDKAHSKVIFTKNCSPNQLIQAAEDWEAGCCNTPKTDLGERIIPFPLQVARIVNNVWKQNGELAQGKTAVERMKYYQGMELLLDIMQENMICNYLHILLTHSSGLVNYIGNWVHGGSKCKDKTEEKMLEKLKNETVLLLSVIGLLLYKLDERKEKYVEKMAYLLGQLLKISDELHTLYCKVVRSGDVPPQLVGSALFATASETPNQAIAQLSLRMNPYITWAKQYRFKNTTTKNEESWRAGWYLGLFEYTANELHTKMKDSMRLSDYDKAQLFIGYLASFPKKESSVTTIGYVNENYNNIGGIIHE